MKIQQFNPIVVAICGVLLFISCAVWRSPSLSDIYKHCYNIVAFSMMFVLVTFEIWRLESSEVLKYQRDDAWE